MPHLEVQGAVDLAGFHARFRPRALQDQGRVLRLTEAFLSARGTSLLLECLTVEGNLRQSFFALVAAGGGGAMVRLLPRTMPEQTDGVKRCLVWIALWLQSETAGATLGKTNLQEWLVLPFAGGEP